MFGLIPELIGRLPVLAHLEPLRKEDLALIMTEPKNALIKQYTKLFELEGIKFSMSKDAIEFISEKALEFKLGARGLRSICEAILMDAMYELPSPGRLPYVCAIERQRHYCLSLHGMLVLAP